MSTDETLRNKIDGTPYICEMMPALKANATLINLIELVGRPALVMAADVFEASETTGSIDFGALVRVGMEQIFLKLTPEEGNQVMLVLMSGVTFPGCGLQKDLSDEEVFNTHFRGKLLSAYKVWAWSLQCNYQDFLDAAKSSGLIDAAKAMKKKAHGLITPTLTESPDP